MYLRSIRKRNKLSLIAIYLNFYNTDERNSVRNRLRTELDSQFAYRSAVPNQFMYSVVLMLFFYS